MLARHEYKIFYTFDKTSWKSPLEALNKIDWPYKNGFLDVNDWMIKNSYNFFLWQNCNFRPFELIQWLNTFGSNSEIASVVHNLICVGGWLSTQPYLRGRYTLKTSNKFFVQTFFHEEKLPYDYLQNVQNSSKDGQNSSQNSSRNVKNSLIHDFANAKV